MLKSLVAVCVLGLSLSAVGHATTISPGSTVAASAVSYSGPQVGYYNQNNVNTGTFIGNFAVSVYADSTNAFCAGCLDFVYAVANVGGTGAINDLVAGFFNVPYQANVGFTGTQGDAPTTITRTTNGLIDFHFAGMTQGHFSQFLVVQTDARTFDAGVIRTSIGMEGTQIAGLEPAASPVPEPGTLALLGTGLLGVAGIAKRKLGI